MVHAKGNAIQVSHINVRQSIFFLIVKLLVIESSITALVFFLSFPLACVDFSLKSYGQEIISLHTLFFLCLSTLKLALSVYVIFFWLNEYYEVETTKIVHKKGFIFMKEEYFDYNQVVRIGINQSFLGKLFNYGTVTLHERFTNKTFYLYLIHNPLGVFHIIEKLIPHIGEDQIKIREHIVEPEEGG